MCEFLSRWLGHSFMSLAGTVCVGEGWGQITQGLKTTTRVLSLTKAQEPCWDLNRVMSCFSGRPHWRVVPAAAHEQRASGPGWAVLWRTGRGAGTR